MKYFLTVPLIAVFLFTTSLANAENTKYTKSDSSKSIKSKNNHKEHKDGFVKGKPFVYLTNLITTNQQVIGSLEFLVTQLTGDVNGLRTEFVAQQARYQSDIPRLDALIAAGDALHQADASRLSLAIADANTKHQVDVSRLDSSITDANVRHQADVSRLDASIVDVTARQLADVSRLDTSIATAGTQHQTDVARLESLITAEKQALSSVQLELKQLLSDLSADVINLKILVEQDTAPRLVSAEGSISTINNQIVDINSAISTLDQQVVNLDERVVQLESASIVADPATVIGTLCLSVTNAAGIDINNKDWFDQCVATAGNSVRVVLKDGAGNIVYSANGMKNNVWTQDNITSTVVPKDQYLSFNHNYMITLDNGDNLMISGKSAANTGCGGSFGNGYGITIYGPFPNYISNPIMLVMPYNQFNTYVGARTFYGWTAAHEITYKNNMPFGTCSTVNGSSVAESSFVGTFEFYVY